MTKPDPDELVALLRQSVVNQAEILRQIVELGYAVANLAQTIQRISGRPFPQRGVP